MKATGNDSSSYAVYFMVKLLYTFKGQADIYTHIH